MLQQKELLEEVMEKVVGKVVEGMKQSISEAVERELSSTLSKTLVESEFYRRISDEMRGGLQNIYKQIAEATRPSGGGQTATEAAAIEGAPVSADKLFNEASQQLDEILTTTEKATFEIMDVVEKHMTLQSQAQELLKGLRKTRKSNPAIHELIEINDELEQSLMRIMTSLSFQDLTGQRIKKIIQALKIIEGIVFELYMSTGLAIKAKEAEPEKDVEEIRQESQKRASELKGPQVGTSQSDIDDLLAQLNLE